MLELSKSGMHCKNTCIHRKHDLLILVMSHVTTFVTVACIYIGTVGFVPTYVLTFRCNPGPIEYRLYRVYGHLCGLTHHTLKASGPCGLSSSVCESRNGPDTTWFLACAVHIIILNS